MDSLANYGSDDDYDSSEDKKQEWRPPARKETPPKQNSSQMDANYEEVQMELSEESDEQPSSKMAHKDRDRHSRRDRRNRRDDDRERKPRHRRSSSRERRQRSRSPRRTRRRSASRERNERNERKERNTKRYDRASNKIAQLEKLGIEIKTPDSQFLSPSDLQKSLDEQKRGRNDGDKDRFFMPGITGRFREQIERRKLLWQKKEPEKQEEAVSSGTSATSSKVWETTTFAQDQDGKVANKFKRLMGIRGQSEGPNSQTDVLKKQEEMFSSMEQQYEVARTATHTMRGVGLGFGSFQR